MRCTRGLRTSSTAPLRTHTCHGSRVHTRAHAAHCHLPCPVTGPTATHTRAAHWDHLHHTTHTHTHATGCPSCPPPPPGPLPAAQTDAGHRRFAHSPLQLPPLPRLLPRLPMAQDARRTRLSTPYAPVRGFAHTHAALAAYERTHARTRRACAALARTPRMRCCCLRHGAAVCERVRLPHTVVARLWLQAPAPSIFIPCALLGSCLPSFLPRILHTPIRAALGFCWTLFVPGQAPVLPTCGTRSIPACFLLYLLPPFYHICLFLHHIICYPSVTFTYFTTSSLLSYQYLVFLCVIPIYNLVAVVFFSYSP